MKAPLLFIMSTIFVPLFPMQSLLRNGLRRTINNSMRLPIAPTRFYTSEKEKELQVCLRNLLHKKQKIEDELLTIRGLKGLQQIAQNYLNDFSLDKQQKRFYINNLLNPTRGSLSRSSSNYPVFYENVLCNLHYPDWNELDLARAVRDYFKMMEKEEIETKEKLNHVNIHITRCYKVGSDEGFSEGLEIVHRYYIPGKED